MDNLFLVIIFFHLFCFVVNNRRALNLFRFERKENKSVTEILFAFTAIYLKLEKCLTCTLTHTQKTFSSPYQK